MTTSSFKPWPIFAEGSVEISSPRDRQRDHRHGAYFRPALKEWSYAWCEGVEESFVRSVSWHRCFLLRSLFPFLHTVANSVPVAHLAKSARHNSLNRFFFEGL